MDHSFTSSWQKNSANKSTPHSPGFDGMRDTSWNESWRDTGAWPCVARLERNEKRPLVKVQPRFLERLRLGHLLRKEVCVRWSLPELTR